VKFLKRSEYLSTFAHMGSVYLFHDLYGYIMQMSADVLEVIDAFAEPIDASAVVTKFEGRFDGASPAEFIDIFEGHQCLVPTDEEEIDGIWAMVPIKGPWNAWRRDGDRVTIYTAWGDRPVARHELTAEETVLWDAFDGERGLSMLRQDHDAAALMALVTKLVHSDVQALKLCVFPAATFVKQPKIKPPYLTSTMPYPPYVPGSDPAPEPYAGEFGPTEYYRRDIGDAAEQFDHLETTLSHLLRRPHPTLNGRTYGKALVDALANRGALPEGSIRVLEIGGGLGYVAKAVCDALIERGLDVSYEILELAPNLAEAQRARCEGLPVTVREADIAEAELGEAAYDLILANEMIGDLAAMKVPLADIDDIGSMGEAGAFLAEQNLEFRTAPDPVYINLGALQLIYKLRPVLAPGGTAVLTEFGELHHFPRLSTHLDHPELSIHFGHMMHTAKNAGFEASFEYVIDLLDFERSLEGMSTTRSYYRALSALLADVGVTLEKIGYTREMFGELIEGKVDADSIGDIRYDKIEDRLMGLVPHEFKALVLKAPAAE
jgi:hypothetical protein